MYIFHQIQLNTVTTNSNKAPVLVHYKLTSIGKFCTILVSEETNS